MQNPILFVHSPKTGGTSFRFALEEHFSSKAVLSDYGKAAAATSPEIQQHIYSDNADAYKLHKLIEEKQYKVIQGHIYLRKYLSLTQADKVVTFLRDPVEQTVSHWHHFVRAHDYKHDLETFIHEARFKNSHSLRLGKIPFFLIGHVLITERYNESLRIFNHDYGLDIQEKKVNINEAKTTERYAIDADIREKIETLNAKDISLYKQADAMLTERLRVLDAGYDWVYGDAVLKDNILRGWAYRKNRQAVEMKIQLNGKIVDVIRAVDLAHNLLQYSVPRKACIGFKIDLPRLKKGDFLECMVADSGQVLGSFNL